MATVILKETYSCLDDCIQEGCPKHEATLSFQTVTNIYTFENGKGETYNFEQREIETLINLLKELSKRRPDSLSVMPQNFSYKTADEIDADLNDFLKLVSSWRGTEKSIKIISKTADEIDAALNDLISSIPEARITELKNDGYVIVISSDDYNTLVNDKYLQNIDNYKGFGLIHSKKIMRGRYCITTKRNITNEFLLDEISQLGFVEKK